MNKISARPFLGWGAETSETVFNSVYKEAGMPLLGIIIDREHNLILDVLMWSGALGLIFFVGWHYLGFKNLDKFEMKLAFISFLIFSFIEPLSIVHWILLIIIVNI